MTRGRKTGGRVAGTPNRVTAAVRSIASQYSAEAIGVLVELMRHSDDDRTRLVAAKELLDRAHGRSHQSIAETPPGGETIILQWQNAEEPPDGAIPHLLDTTVETTVP